MKKGDIVLIPFPFTDLTGVKNRPAIILYSSDEDVVICFLTTQLKWRTDFDLTILPNNYNGIKKESLIRVTKIVTLSKSLVIGKIGSLQNEEIQLLNKSIIKAFKLK